MKRIYLVFLIAIAFLIVTPAVKADTGPKPRAEYTLFNLEKSDYIVCIIYKGERWGPHVNYKKYENNVDYINLKSLRLVDEKVVLPDYFYLLDIALNYYDTNKIIFKTGYLYSINNYKLLVYDILNDKAYFSNEINNYAFNSYYHYDFSKINGNEFEMESEGIKFVFLNILFFIVRLIITIGIELLIAIPFKFDKKSIIIIIIVNAITQVLLNLLLTFGYINQGKNIFLWIYYILIEVAITLIESIIYKRYCKIKLKHHLLVILYAFLANLVSFEISFLIWLIPWM